MGESKDIELLTFSRYQTRMDCPKKDFWRYENGLALRLAPRSLSVGSACHLGWQTGNIEKAIALYDSEHPVDQTEADHLEIDRITVEAILKGSFILWVPPDRAEVQFRVPIMDPTTGDESPAFILGGKIDGILDDDEGRWLVEYKTAGRLDKPYVDRLQLDTQITLYIHALQAAEGIPIAGVRYRVARKPSLRRGQKEAADHFRQRVIDDYQTRPEWYFREFKLYRSQEDIAAFRGDLWAFTQRLLADRKAGWHPKNTSRCAMFGACAYMPLCTHQADAADLYVTRPIHSELIEEEDGSDVA